MMFFNAITERRKRTKTGDGKRTLDGHGVLTEKAAYLRSGSSVICAPNSTTRPGGNWK